MISRKPRVFIGSSKRGEPLVEQLVEAFGRKRDVVLRPWMECFPASATTVESLEAELRGDDFAAFFFLPDDVATSGGKGERNVTRDNVVLEFGFFVGCHERRRAFVLRPKGLEVDLPTDLDGLTWIGFELKGDGERLKDPAGLARDLRKRIRKMGPAPRTPQGVHMVEAIPSSYRSHTTIAAAVEAAAPGDAILIRPGNYCESLTIRKPLELIGFGVLDSGEGGKVKIIGDEGPAITYRAVGGGVGRLSHLSLDLAPGGDASTLEISEGNLHVEFCDIKGDGFACVAVESRASGHLFRNHIHDGRLRGIYVDGGEAEITSNVICGHQYTCVEILDSEAKLTGNHIEGSIGGGGVLLGGGSPVIKDNEIAAHRWSGVTVEGGSPTIEGNRISRCGEAGVWLGQPHDEPGPRSSERLVARRRIGGVILNNDIFRNSGTGIHIGPGADPEVEANRLRDGHGPGVVIAEGGEGGLKDNRIRDQKQAGVKLHGRPRYFRDNRVQNGRQEGVVDYVDWEGRDENTVEANAGGEWVVPDREQSAPYAP